MTYMWSFIVKPHGHYSSTKKIFIYLCSIPLFWRSFFACCVCVFITLRILQPWIHKYSIKTVKNVHAIFQSSKYTMFFISGIYWLHHTLCFLYLQQKLLANICLVILWEFVWGHIQSYIFV